MTEKSSRSAWRRRLSRRRLVAAALSNGAGLAATGLIGCSSARSGRPTASGAASPAAQMPGGTPQSGGTFHTYFPNDTPLDPHRSSGTAQQAEGGELSRLFRFVTSQDAKVTDDHNLENDLGLSAESPDGVTWMIKLRPGAKFHNIPPVNGHAVEAEDVKATFARALDPALSFQYAGALGMIDPSQISTPDTQTVVFKLKYPYAPFKRTLAQPIYSVILPHEAQAGSYDVSKTVIGSGPFILSNQQTDVAWTHRKNPDWLERGRPYVDEMQVSIIPDVSQQIAQFAAGNLDEVRPSINDVEAIQRNNPKAQLVKTDSGAPYVVRFQLGDPTGPLQDIRVRQAFSMALDRDVLGQTLFFGQAIKALVMPKSIGKWSITISDLDSSVAPYYQYNLGEAKKLLSAAGAASSRFKLAYVATGLLASPTYLKLAEAVHSMFAALGVGIDLVPLDYIKDWVDSGKGYRAGYYPKDTVVVDATSPVYEPDELLFGYYDSTSTSNISHLNDKDLDAMIVKERSTLNEDERLKAVLDIQKYIASKVYLAPAIGQAYNYAFIQPRVQNYCFTASYGVLTESFSKVWLTA